MRFSLFIITISIFSCSPNAKKDDKALNDSSSVANRAFEQIAVSWTELKDTTLNGIKLKFRPINKSSFDSLIVLAVKTEIQYQGFDDLLVNSKACQIIKIQNGSAYSLCDVKDEKSGYFEKYTIRGLWKEKNSLVVNYNDWESNVDFLINLHDGSVYHLNDIYEISPDQNYILGYNTAIVFGNEFMYSEISNKPAKTLFQIDFGKVAVTNLRWLNETECVLSAGVIRERSMEFKKELYYVMNIAK